MKPNSNSHIPLRLLLLGDIFLGGDLSPSWNDLHFDPFSKIHSLVRDGDIIYGNIETSFFRGPLRPFRSNHLWSPPESICALQKLGLDVAGYANNHVMDYGASAMMRSATLLGEKGICCIGAGWTLAEASKGCVIERNGLKIGFLAYTTNAFHVRSITAGRLSTGSASMRKKYMKSDIERLRTEVDMLCVCLHWGYEFLNVPHPKQRKLASQLIKWGSDVIIGTHPHVVQGYESIFRRPVFYSLGNFLFPGYECLNGSHFSWPKENNESIIGIVEITENDGNLKFNISSIPVFFEFPYVKLMTGQEKEKFENRLEKWNQALRGEDAAKSIIEEAMAEMKKQSKRWIKSRPIDILRRIVLEPILMLLGPHRISAIKLILKRKKVL